MLFNSLSFLVFFPITLFIYFIIPRKIRYIWLLVTSYFFYMCWNPKYILLLFGSTAVTYVGSLLLWQWRDKTWRKRITALITLVANFGVLFLFKYLEFTTVFLQKVMGMIGIVVPDVPFSLVLPVGISFYIFQAVGYMIDVYRGQLEPEKNFLRYALFVSFFPQLVAGPIERSTNLLPQMKRLEELKLWNGERVRAGALIMLYGYILKMVIADRAAFMVDTVYDVNLYSQYGGITVWVAAALFSLQIYCDFAGYTYIAIGAAKIMGVELKNNFNTPYLATSIRDFWDRWHMSLSTWFRDYLYFPLGGSKKGKVRKYLNILIVFTVSGLWHGAGWHYVVWGALHGIARVAGEMTEKIREKIRCLLRIKTEVLSYKLFRMLLTFALVTVIWVFFRGPSVRQCVDMIGNMFGTWNPWVLFDGTLLSLGLDGKEWNVLLVAILFLAIVECFVYKKVSLVKVFGEQNLMFQLLFFYIGIIAVVVFGVYGPVYNASQFIYFQF